jgi:RNA polymerase primary sigma factor
VPISKRQNVIRTLLEKSGVQGFLTTDDLMEAAPDADPADIRVLLSFMTARGIDVYDEGDATESLADATSREADAYPGERDLIPDDALASEDTIGLYLKEMSRVPLLSVQEELQIAAR